MAEPEPPDDQGNRAIENAVMLGFFVVLVAAGIWHQARREDARRRVRAVSSRLLSQVFPHGVRL